ncbi:MAG: hypothetical protein AABZ60_22585 [Planctomycetota bacterium]|mgnify:CR=1 FL=1
MNLKTKYIVILTEDRFECPQQPDWYVSQVLQEEQMLQLALENEGLSVIRRSWSRKDWDWRQAKMAIFRSTWDYANRLQEFLEWLERVSTQTRLVNSLETIRWNLDKHYFLDLEKAGVPTVSTCFVEKGSRTSLSELVTKKNWNSFVFKPAISAGARQTHRGSVNELGSSEKIWASLLNSESMMLQPFQSAIETEGEISLIFMGGEFTHAIRKTPKSGDFRVQDDHGGKVHPYPANAEEIQFGTRAIQACSPQPIYARVDCIRDTTGHLAIMELELLEPELFLRFYPPSAEKLAKKIAQLASSF